MKRIIALTLFFTAAWAFSQSPSIKSGPPPATMKSQAPEIPIELQRDAFKAQSAYLQAETALEQTPQFKDMTTKRDALTAMSQKLAAACGDKFMLQLDQKSGDPVCLPKPEPPKPAPAEKK